jgi:hypothetical protein
LQFWKAGSEIRTRAPALVVLRAKYCDPSAPLGMTVHLGAVATF